MKNILKCSLGLTIFWLCSKSFKFECLYTLINIQNAGHTSVVFNLFMNVNYCFVCCHLSSIESVKHIFMLVSVVSMLILLYLLRLHRPCGLLQ